MGFFRGGQVIQSPVDSGVGNCNLVMHYLAFGSWIPLEYWIDCTPALEHDLDCETRRTGFRKVLNGETNKGKYSILDIQPPHRSHRSDPIYKHIYTYHQSNATSLVLSGEEIIACTEIDEKHSRS